MFCKNCGASMPDGSSFCSQCGARADVPVENNVPAGNHAGDGYGYNQNVQPDYSAGQQAGEPYQQGYAGEYYGTGEAAAAQVQTAKKNRLVGIIAVAAVAVIAIVVVLILVLGGGSKGAKNVDGLVDQYVEAMTKADGGKLLDLMPEEFVDEAVEQSGMDRKNLESYMDMALSAATANLDTEYGKGWKVTAEVTDEYDYEGSELTDLQANFMEEYGIEVEAAKEVEFDITIEYKDGSDTDWDSLEVIKVDGKWYIVEPF